jgi:hypothetical protein
MGGLFSPRESVVSPHITPVFPSLPQLVSTHAFPFQKATVSITVPVNDSVYKGARIADKSVTIYGNVSENVWVADSYRSMVNDPAQEELYTSLIGEFGKIRRLKGLSDDEYLELETTFIQSLRYETLPQSPAKFPIETVVDGAGDCDDKSLLLAGLLSREGYRVALLSFGPEIHMAVGVGSDDYLYKNTDFAFVETTNISFVGVPPDTLRGNITLKSAPTIIPIGNGTKIYRSGRETRYINNMFSLSGQKARELELQVKSLEPELKEKRERIAQLEAQMQLLKSAGNIRDYNAQVSVHNELVSDNNALRNMYLETYSRYERYARVYNYIFDHAYDRYGTYEYVKKNMPA